MQEDRLCKGVIEKLIVSQLMKNFLFLGFAKTHNILYHNLPPDPVLSQKDPVHILRYYRLGFNKLHPHNKYFFLSNVFKDSISNSNNVTSRG